MYFEYYIMGIILLPGIIFAIYAQSKVNSTYAKYSRVVSRSGTTANELVRNLLNVSGLNDIRVKRINGNLTDNYNPQTQEINLSQGVYDSTSLSALGVACHEFGHALQKKEHYVPYVLRKILVPVTNIASTLLWPLVIIGLILNIGADTSSIVGQIFLWSGIGFFGVAVLFNLATLPVEYDASRRAIKILQTTGTLDEEELGYTKEVLNAAALTYVAALVVSMLNMVRFLLVISRNNRR